MVGISCDTPEENAAFKAKFDFPYSLLCDTDRSVSRTYGAIESDDATHPKRISYLIDSEGNIKKAYATVTPADHPDEVLGDI